MNEMKNMAAPAAVAVPDEAQIKTLMRKHRIWIEHSTLFEDDEPPRELRAVQAEQHQFEAFVQELIALAATPAAAPVVLPEPVAFALEWTFDGEERGIRLYDDERHCRLDAESDGGVCSPLYTEQQVRALLATGGQAQAVERGEVLVTVSGFTGSGKSAIAGEIEILCRALGLQVEWPDGESEKNMTHADWTAALEQYKPRVRIVEQNIPFASKKGLSE